MARVAIWVWLLRLASGLRQGSLKVDSDLPAVSHVPADATWVDCGYEGQGVSQAGLARFGFGDSWVQAQLPQGATCSSAAFGGKDPSPGMMKLCQCQGGNATASRMEREEMGVKWKRCAGHGEPCECRSGDVRFGNGTRWIHASFANEPEIRCASPSFDGLDPFPGAVEECWCDVSKRRPRSARVAIVLLTRQPADFRTWVTYHLDYMGVNRIFVSVEDTPDFNATMQTLPPRLAEKVTIWRAVDNTTAADKRPKDDYQSLQSRQLRAMSKAKVWAKAFKIDWLIHIDDDELLYTPMHRKVGEVLGAMSKGFSQAFIPNVEAVFPSSEVQHCFAETKKVNTNVYSFQSYANGKAAVRVADEAAHPFGPHQWRGSHDSELNSIHLDQEPFGAPLLVIHYESCPFKRWESKFWELGNTSPEQIKKIPFEFYKKSIMRMRGCIKEGEKQDSAIRRGVSTDCGEAALKELWSNWKTVENPRIRTQDLMPIQIPWEQLQHQ